jgi:hypothetical protein
MERPDGRIDSSLFQFSDTRLVLHEFVFQRRHCGIDRTHEMRMPLALTPLVFSQSWEVVLVIHPVSAELLVSFSFPVPDA